MPRLVRCSIVYYHMGTTCRPPTISDWCDGSFGRWMVYMAKNKKKKRKKYITDHISSLLLELRHSQSIRND